MNETTKSDRSPAPDIETAVNDATWSASISSKTRRAKSTPTAAVPEMRAVEINQSDFAPNLFITKKQAARKVANLLRRAGANYEATKSIFREARRIAGLKPERKAKRQPRLPTAEQLHAFFKAVDKGNDVQHRIMIRLALYSGLRVSELCNLRRDDIDIDAGTVRVIEGKGGKDRVSLIPQSFRLPLAAFMEATPTHRYLFETRRRSKFTPRRVQQIVKQYSQAAGLGDLVHPHVLRHVCLTTLGRAGVADGKVQKISGHASRRSLELYQHLGLGDVRDDFERAWAGQGV